MRSMSHLRHHIHVVIETLCYALRILRLIVPAAQRERVAREGAGEERLRFFVTEYAALQLQAAHGIGGQLRVIGRIDCAEAALGIDV